MSYVLAALGFAVLVVAHEAGHFVVAKAVGMRVERFSLFFGPMFAKFRRGETEYGIGVIPLGGYVKITGMNPGEDIPEEFVGRAYYNQPVWKRVVTILAGPAVNILIAFAIIWGLFLSQGQAVPNGHEVVVTVAKGTPAARALEPGDRLVSIDGVAVTPTSLRRQLDTHRCAGEQLNGCSAATPAKLVVQRAGRRLAFSVRPRYNAADHRPLLGLEFASGTRQRSVSTVKAASLTASGEWQVTTATVSAIARIFQPKERKQLSGVVGVYTVTQETFATSTTQALKVLALISLSLGIINLFPFLPLDGGHVFWALAEKVRGRRIPFAMMERAGMVGVILIVALFAIGLSNDISKLSGSGFNVH